MKIGFTGTQVGMTEAQKNTFRDVIRTLNRLTEHRPEFHHGDCIGADQQAHWIARTWEMFIVVHPPERPEKRAFCSADIMREPLPYIMRNHQIVDETDILIATPNERREKVRSGTWATIRWARKWQRPTVIIFPDGTAEEYGSISLTGGRDSFCCLLARDVLTCEGRNAHEGP